ncbi:leucyl tRS [Acrasis kona]|uniref:leucine--tRNA ligase n=1 Tax=Acrasis kona TaxID=1008807 RepID=A0AAW2ZJA1_9EUKA
MKTLQFEFDWDREVTTCAPEYYKWTQWLFLQLFKSGLAYRKNSIVNWDPVDHTVLANEQVGADGRSWRSGAIVERRQLDQWFFNVRKYAERLVDDLETLPDWPNQVKNMQRKWIGKSDGCEIEFQVQNTDQILTAFTTRPETLFGVTFVSISPDSTDVINALPLTSKKRKEVDDFIKNRIQTTNHHTSRQAEDTTIGINLDIFVSHPCNKQRIPIFIANYVVGGYGTGCVMGVPAHDSRDALFAKAHHLQSIQVIDEQKNTLINSSDSFNGMSVEEARRQITLKIGNKATQYRLKDWLVSRQRYWGAPIPIIHCPTCGPVPVPEDQLPVELPKTPKELEGKEGTSPLARDSEWVNVKCPCGKGVDCKRDTDTMDTFVDSSWYFLRYCTNKQDRDLNAFSDKNNYMNVDLYVGGIEHAVLHLLYARFVQKFLYDKGLVNDIEPFKRLLAQGMVTGKTFKDPVTGRYLKPDEPRPSEFVWEKMSKSKYNGVDPGDVVEKFGSDVVRLYVLFKAPFEKELEWEESQIVGQKRFLNQVERLLQKYEQRDRSIKTVDTSVNTFRGYVQHIRDGLSTSFSFNTCISSLHQYVGDLQNVDVHSESFENAISNLPSLLAPFTPEFAQQLFEKLNPLLPEGHRLRTFEHVSQTPFPQPSDFSDDSSVKNKDVVSELVVMLNGKKRTVLADVPIGVANEQSIEEYIREVQYNLLPPKVTKVIVINRNNKVSVNFVCG